MNTKLEQYRIFNEAATTRDFDSYRTSDLKKR